MNNPFIDLNDSDLLKHYNCFVELNKTGICSSEPLRSVLDKYCDDYSPNGIYRMTNDLMIEIARRWASLSVSIDYKSAWGDVRLSLENAEISLMRNILDGRLPEEEKRIRSKVEGIRLALEYMNRYDREKFE